MRTNLIFKTSFVQGGITYPHRERALTANISSEGICFSSPISLSPHRKLELEISLPSEPSLIQLAGEVIWSQLTEDPTQRYRTGIRLVGDDCSSRSRYLIYVANQVHRCSSSQ